MRRMFGKTGLFCDGVMLGMVTDNMLYLRDDDDNRDTFEKARPSPPLSYEKGGSTIDLSFWRAPERLFDKPKWPTGKSPTGHSAPLVLRLIMMPSPLPLSMKAIAAWEAIAIRTASRMVLRLVLRRQHIFKYIAVC